ncbi:hypothetical protein CI102_1448 [Trichoderma harzianum]|uniref:Uncharacterized protein n=1 Tax=Trichoderma harzianum CBS 226.95 TaxID=983964 RepID=A0A2T4ADG0_TRIHA|nr:hypothetical protein M431DRAFT_437047 [Trichoderma harzianum CBS 226.95]PKK53676.1 hypothetical protein CI102_1448 [Trichoderma harzianum]PTB55076.1 hypothetical protein M431DRAFT_437047 [Trichoderma harzianum CBS 226.95]
MRYIEDGPHAPRHDPWTHAENSTTDKKDKREEGESAKPLAFAPIPIPQCNRYAPEQFWAVSLRRLTATIFFVSCFPWATQATRLLLKPNSLNLDRRTNVAREMRGVGNKAKKSKKRSTNDKKKRARRQNGPISASLAFFEFRRGSKLGLPQPFGLFDHWMKGKCRFLLFLQWTRMIGRKLFFFSFVSAGWLTLKYWAKQAWTGKEKNEKSLGASFI